MRQNTEDENMRKWFKVTIPYGIKYDKAWLMNSVQSHCSVPFTPVDDASAASALKDVSYKIYDDENQKICIFVNHFTAPYSVKNKLKPGQMEMLKLTMNKWYNVSQQALDLQNLRFDPDLMGRVEQIRWRADLSLRPKIVATTLTLLDPNLLSLNLCNNKLYQLEGLSDIIEKASKVKTLNLSKNKLESAWELGKVKGLKLKELWLEGNPLCSTFSDQSAHVRSCYPGLLCLLSAPMIVDIDSSEIMKPCKESYTGSETLKSIVLSPHPAPSLLLFSSIDLQRQLLKHTKCPQNVDSLSALPETQHDFSSILVDMWCQTVNTCFLPRAGPESQSWWCLLSLKWKDGLRVLILPSRGLSSLPLATIPVCAS
uniref:Nuclear RNA export factor 5 n=1 Tax=Pongo abelii TaxID=9601 RepID=H2PWA5_PONAB